MVYCLYELWYNVYMLRTLRSSIGKTSFLYHFIRFRAESAYDSNKSYIFIIIYYTFRFYYYYFALVVSFVVCIMIVNTRQHMYTPSINTLFSQKRSYMLGRTVVFSYFRKLKLVFSVRLNSPTTCTCVIFM